MDKQILIVDDEQEVLDLLEDRLTSTGFKTQRAMNGMQALEKVRKSVFDLIITDVFMPDMDGFALFKELKRAEATANIPIVILSKRAKMQDTFLSMGATAFISKPFDLNHLLKEVNMTLGIAESGVKEPSLDPLRQEKLSASDETEDTKSLSGDQKKILIAGGSQKVMRKMQKLLEKKGYVASLCIEGKEILPQYNQIKPDVLLVEVVMRDTLVHEVIRRLRKQPDFGSRPIIVFSHLDKEDLDGDSVPQRTLKIENSRTICMDAGAVLAMGGFEEDKFIPMIERFINR